MKEEIKEILDRLKKLCYDDYCLEFSVDYIDRKEEKLLLDCITNLQKTQETLIKNDNEIITNLQEENKKLKEIAHKMHLWIFLHSEDEQKVYDELGLTDEENIILGYSGQFKLKGDKDD